MFSIVFGKASGFVFYCFWIFVAACGVLGWAGAKPPEGVYLLAARVATAYYFFHFLVLLPLLSKIEKPLPRPVDLSSYKNTQ